MIAGVNLPLFLLEPTKSQTKMVNWSIIEKLFKNEITTFRKLTFDFWTFVLKPMNFQEQEH
jgi:hypothetical protein